MQHSSSRILLALALAWTAGISACSGLSPSESEDGLESQSAESGEARGGDEPAGVGDSGAPDEGDQAAPASGSGETDTSGSEADDSSAAPANALASVNGEILPLSDFQRQAFDTQRYHVDQGGIDPNTEDGQNKLLFLRRQVLNDMIDQMLIEQAAAEMGITASDEEVEARMADFIEELGGETAFEASLEDAGTTREDVFEMERASLIGHQMLERIAADVPETAEFVRARHILCATAEACESLRQRIETGEAFEDLAAEASEDETSSGRGGDLDWVSRGMLLSSQLEDAIFALEPGELSPVVETDLGYHLIELTDRDPARTLPEAQRTQLKERALLEWLAERRASSEIEIYVEDLRDEANEDAG